MARLEELNRQYEELTSFAAGHKEQQEACEETGDREGMRRATRELRQVNAQLRWLERKLEYETLKARA